MTGVFLELASKPAFIKSASPRLNERISQKTGKVMGKDTHGQLPHAYTHMCIACPLTIHTHKHIDHMRIYTTYAKGKGEGGGKGKPTREYVLWLLLFSLLAMCLSFPHKQECHSHFPHNKWKRCWGSLRLAG